MSAPENGNRILIKHQDGDCTYQIESIDLTITDGLLDLEIEARPNPDCCLGILPEPTLTIEDAELGVATLDELKKETLKVADGWETDGEEKEENIFRIYLGQHTSLDNNQLVLERISGDRIQITWKCDAEDFNYYDERARRNEVEVSCVYEIGS